MSRSGTAEGARAGTTPLSSLVIAAPALGIFQPMIGGPPESARLMGYSDVTVMLGQSGHGAMMLYAASASSISVLRRSVMACTLAESPSDPLDQRLRQLRSLRRRFDCYRVERTSSPGAGPAPAEVQRLSGRTVTPTIATRSR